MSAENPEVLIPVFQEDVTADVRPVETGRVRVTKAVESHEELIEQELRKGHVSVKRVKMNRIVDGPQQPQKSGNTLIIPVVSEVLRIEKQWVVTEEIHLTQQEEVETVQQRVTLAEEHAVVERLDDSGEVVSRERDEPADPRKPAHLEQRVSTPPTNPSPRILSRPLSILPKK